MTNYCNGPQRTAMEADWDTTQWTAKNCKEERYAARNCNGDRLKRSELS